MIVLDASIAVKWLLAEPDTDRATRFLGTHQSRLVAPDLIAIEVAGALVRKGNGEKMFAADAVAALEKWAAMLSANVVRRVSMTEAGLLRAAKLAIVLGHPLKDCIYLALAVELGAELATSDAKFRDRAAPGFPNVRLLSSYEP